MANGKGGMYDMPVFGTGKKNAPRRNRLGQTPAQAAAAKKAVAANLLLPEERHYNRADFGESSTMKSERLEGERMGRERGTTVASRRRETFARGSRPQSANMKRFLALKEQRRVARAKQAQQDLHDLSF